MTSLLNIILLCLLTVGCTSKQLYQARQNHQKNECMKNATSGSEHDECVKSQRKSYEEYEKERKDIIHQ